MEYDKKFTGVIDHFEFRGKTISHSGYYSWFVYPLDGNDDWLVIANNKAQELEDEYWTPELQDSLSQTSMF
ncbi:MAG: hypothetical protein VKL42_01750 [Snowella sp.]|nr:hypothetical protein [Snowella sp.]